MPTVERLQAELADVLPRLHDPTLVPSAFLREMVGVSAEEGAVAVQARILALIDELQPNASAPPGSRAHREYAILRNRYVLGLTQEVTAERMRIGVRTVQRLQSQATHALAVHLWQTCLERQEQNAEVDAGERSAAGLSDWQAQTRQELAALSANEPHAISDVRAIISDVLDDALFLGPSPGHKIQIGFAQAGLESPIHPIALRQILITALRRLARCITGDAITIYARSEEGQVRITITGTVAAEETHLEDDLLRDIVAPDSVSLCLDREADVVFLSIWLPTTGAVTVLVVDDNADMVQFYRRCTAGSRYRIMHAQTARAMFEMLEQSQPDIIVLDVMLPDEDGWHVLMRLHENPETRPIPVLLVTVVREQELALSLGAAAYLGKPVPPGHFIETLDSLARQG